MPTFSLFLVGDLWFSPLPSQLFRYPAGVFIPGNQRAVWYTGF